MPKGAAIFDLDGTLVDNMRFHAETWVEICKELGQSRPQEFFETVTAGKKNSEILRLLLGPKASDEQIARVGARKEARYRERFRPVMAPVPGAVELLARLALAGTPCAIATLAPRENRDMVLDGLGLRRFFTVIIGAEQSPRGKPHPDIYLAAAQALGAATGDCVAFEDAVNGVRSAVAAGIDTAAVTTGARAPALLEAGARWILEDFTRIPEALLQRLC